MTHTPTGPSTELLIIGAGIAGLAAGVFASKRQVDTILVGSLSELNFATGVLDLLGVHPIESGCVWDDPRAALEKLTRDLPKHPYARLAAETVFRSFDEFLTALEQSGQPYQCHRTRNMRIITHLGTVKTTYAVPQSMINGVMALENKLPCLLVDFQGLRGFSAKLIADNLKSVWPDLKPLHLDFPGKKGELYAEAMAGSLENPDWLPAVAQLIKPHLEGMVMVGLPAILGMHYSERVQDDLEALLGRPVFEIPTMPPSITGMRLHERLVARLRAKGVHTILQKKVLNIKPVDEGGFICEIGSREPEMVLKADSILLATGRFFGHGLAADRRIIRETVFHLPVFQPAGREGWYNRDYFSLTGHGVNQAGIEIDRRFRPLDSRGSPKFNRLFAAGSILAHQDWKRQKCGAGLAIATAYAAVESLGIDRGGDRADD
jgi:glycerol-3-phosphate dehydrogenase subunit B